MPLMSSGHGNAEHQISCMDDQYRATDEVCIALAARLFATRVPAAVLQVVPETGY